MAKSADPLEQTWKDYCSPGPDDATKKRRWRIFLVVEAILLITFVALFAGRITAKVHWPVFIISLLGAWLSFTLPICVLYLIGKPPVMSLAPLFPSKEARAMTRMLSKRPVLDDVEFYARFYRDSGIPPEIPARLRRCFREFLPASQRLVPTDPLPLLDDEIDLIVFVELVQGEFHIRIPKADYENIQWTLADFVAIVQRRTRPESVSLRNPLGVE